MTIGKRIKAAREQAGITQAELGEKIGVSGVAIMRYEKDTRQPRLEQLQRIAAALGVHPGMLMGYVFLGKTDEGLDFYGPSPQKARADTAMDQMTEEGRGKVADYAEDILPRYRAEPAPQPSPAPQEGKDTTPPPDAPEGAEEGE